SEDVRWTRPNDLASPDRERLVGTVDHGGRAAGGPDVDDAGPIDHRGDELRGLVRVGGVEHGAAPDRPEAGDVLKAHLARSIRPDADAGMRAGEPDVGPAHRGHPDEVEGPAPERAVRRGERDPAPNLEADRGRGHLLLGDVHLEVALGESLLE